MSCNFRANRSGHNKRETHVPLREALATNSPESSISLCAYTNALEARAGRQFMFLKSCSGKLFIDRMVSLEIPCRSTPQPSKIGCAIPQFYPCAIQNSCNFDYSWQSTIFDVVKQIKPVYGYLTFRNVTLKVTKLFFTIKIYDFLGFAICS